LARCRAGGRRARGRALQAVVAAAAARWSRLGLLPPAARGAEAGMLGRVQGCAGSLSALPARRERARGAAIHIVIVNCAQALNESVSEARSARRLSTCCAAPVAVAAVPTGASTSSVDLTSHLDEPPRYGATAARSARAPAGPWEPQQHSCSTAVAQQQQVQQEMQDRPTQAEHEQAATTTARRTLRCW
jgi:hypothetical protein